MTFDATETMHARARVTTNLRVAPRRASERRERASRVRRRGDAGLSDAELDSAMLGLSAPPRRLDVRAVERDRRERGKG